MQFCWPTPKWTLPLVPAGLVLSGLLLGGLLLCYPREIVPGFTPAQVALAVLLDFIGAALVLAWFDTRPRVAANHPARYAGIRAGLFAGALWLGEIAFNNLVYASAATRAWIDDSVWAAVALIILAAAYRIARTERFGRGIVAAIWGGTVSGLIACLAALALAVAGMPHLRSDPLNKMEYAARVPGGVPGIDAYFAYETATGALGHLLLLGVAMGALVGLVGAALGTLTRLRTHA